MARPRKPLMLSKVKASMIRVCLRGLGASLRGPEQEREVHRYQRTNRILWVTIMGYITRKVTLKPGK